MGSVLPVRELSGARLPPRLRDLPSVPERVYVVGELPRSAAVAVVGTRTPSPEAADYARELSRRLAAAGVVVVSGGAAGIDTAAHLGALDAGGRTVVVGPSSFDHPYPEGNRELFERAVRTGGAYVSLHEQEVKPRRPEFFARNGVMAALSHVVVVVETRLKGGARNTAKRARQLGRPLFVVPSAPWSPTGAGCIAELRAGARPLGSVRELFAELERQQAAALPLFAPCEPPLPEKTESTGRPVKKRAPGKRTGAVAASCEGSKKPDNDVKLTRYRSSGDASRVLAAVGNQPVHPDEICLQTGLPASRVQALILTLTLEGILVCQPSGHVSRLRI